MGRDLRLIINSGDCVPRSSRNKFNTYGYLPRYTPIFVSAPICTSNCNASHIRSTALLTSAAAGKFPLRQTSGKALPCRTLARAS